MSKEALERLKHRALSDLDSIPKTAISICEKSNDEVMKTYETIKQALERLEKLEKENEKLKKITQKMLNGLNNIVECKPKEIRGFILLFIEEFEDRFKEVLDNAK